MEWTLGKLGAETDIAQSPDGIKSNPMKKFGILDKVKIQKTEFDFWLAAVVSSPKDQEVMALRQIRQPKCVKMQGQILRLLDSNDCLTQLKIMKL
jgi:hypothetical protein